MKIGLLMEDYPYLYEENGETKGLNYDIWLVIKEVLKIQNIEYIHIYDPNYSEEIEKLNQGHYDFLVGSISWKPEYSSVKLTTSIYNQFPYIYNKETNSQIITNYMKKLFINPYFYMITVIIIVVYFIKKTNLKKLKYITKQIKAIFLGGIGLIHGDVSFDLGNLRKFDKIENLNDKKIIVKKNSIYEKILKNFTLNIPFTIVPIQGDIISFYEKNTHKYDGIILEKSQNIKNWKKSNFSLGVHEIHFATNSKHKMFSKKIDIIIQNMKHRFLIKKICNKYKITSNKCLVY